MLTNGLQEPDSVIEASQEYAEEEDSLARFVTEHLKLGGGTAVRVPQADVKRRYKQWCDEQAEKPMSGHMFTRELKKRFQIGSAVSNSVRYYTNATLYKPDVEFDEPGAWNELGGAVSTQKGSTVSARSVLKVLLNRRAPRSHSCCSTLLGRKYTLSTLLARKVY